MIFRQINNYFNLNISNKICKLIGTGHFDIMTRITFRNHIPELVFLCKNGYMDVIRKLLDNEPSSNCLVLRKRRIENYNMGLVEACKNNYFEIVKYLIQKGANNFNSVIFCNDLRIVIFLVEHGVININQVLKVACENNNKKIINYAIEKGANNWNWGLTGAARGNNLDVIKFMIEKGANDFYWAFKYTSKDNIKNYIQYVSRIYPSPSPAPDVVSVPIPTFVT
jgi:hypothetical protein